MIRPPDRIESKAEFLKFVGELLLDPRQNPDTWENPTQERLLEAMAASVHASDNSYRNTGRLIPTNADWQYFADALMAARIYE